MSPSPDLVRRQRRTSSGSVTAYDQGAHLAEWVVDGRPVIWVSSQSEYAPGQAIRGGVPVCWPWFASGPSGQLKPTHGFARRAPWRLTQDESSSAQTQLAWVLTDADVAGQPGAERFPHPFQAELAVTVGEECRVRFTVANTGTEPFTYEAALHTYLHVGEIHQVELTGLDGASYFDKVLRASARQEGPVRFTGETDRVYDSTARVTVHDPALDRALRIEKSGSPTTVVWNPWAEKAAALPDFGKDEWRQMVCVETAAVGSDAVRLEPGAEHALSTTVRIIPGDG
jgi:glucose-6-phosphate 1-epimerase